MEVIRKLKCLIIFCWLKATHHSTSLCHNEGPGSHVPTVDSCLNGFFLWICIDFLSWSSITNPTEMEEAIRSPSANPRDVERCRTWSPDRVGPGVGHCGYHSNKRVAQRPLEAWVCYCGLCLIFDLLDQIKHPSHNIWHWLGRSAKMKHFLTCTWRRKYERGNMLIYTEMLIYKWWWHFEWPQKDDFGEQRGGEANVWIWNQCIGISESSRLIKHNWDSQFYNIALCINLSLLL